MNFEVELVNRMNYMLNVNTFLGHLYHGLTTGHYHGQALVVDENARILYTLIALHADTVEQFSTFYPGALGQDAFYLLIDELID